MGLFEFRDSTPVEAFVIAKDVVTGPHRVVQLDC